ncbi:MAG: NIPSNAP family protein [Verrucomicrobia bacterium]|nr:NIPSNAP family protein [Verrucomicrobiota bacterium]
MHRHRPGLLFGAAALGILSIVVTLFAQPPAVSPTKDETVEKSAKAMEHPTVPGEVIEILTLDIKPGKRDEFHKVYVTQALPLLKKWNFDVIAYGPSLHDANSYYVIRHFKSLEDREKSEDAYYGSDDWKLGPRETIMGLVEHFAYAVVSTETWKKVARLDRNQLQEIPHESKH